MDGNSHSVSQGLVAWSSALLAGLLACVLLFVYHELTGGRFWIGIIGVCYLMLGGIAAAMLHKRNPTSATGFVRLSWPTAVVLFAISFVQIAMS